MSGDVFLSKLSGLFSLGVNEAIGIHPRKDLLNAYDYGYSDKNIPSSIYSAIGTIKSKVHKVEIGSDNFTEVP